MKKFEKKSKKKNQSSTYMYSEEYQEVYVCFIQIYEKRILQFSIEEFIFEGTVITVIITVADYLFTII